MKSADPQLELQIGRVLRLGVATSTVCIAVGLAMGLLDPHGSPRLLEAGILVLIATPAARVMLSIVEYAIARDWTFVVITSIVLLELIGGAIAALVFHHKV